MKNIVTFALVFVTIIANGHLSAQEPFRISPETTYITESLDKSGTMVDYFAAVEQRAYPPEMQTDENGYRIVFRALGDFNGESKSPELLRQRYEKLGLDPEKDKPTMTYIAPRAYVEKRLKENPESLSDLIAHDWQVDYLYSPADMLDTLLETMRFHEFRVAQDWLAENGPALDLVVEAVKKPVFVSPYIRAPHNAELLISELPDISALRDFARGLECRSRIRIATGDIDGAVEDTVVCFRLGRHAEHMSTLIEGLVSIAIESMGGAIPVNNNVDVPINEKQIRRLLKAINELPQKKEFFHKLENERFLALHMTADFMKKNTLPGSFGTKTRKAARSGVDWNIVFEQINDAYDEAMLGNEVEIDTRTNLTSYLTRKGRSEQVARIMITLLLPATQAAANAYDRSDCELNMKRIVLAMLLYERQHGTLPPAFTVDENGRPLHGWRTLLLPYFEDETLADLHSQIRLDEPWDSEHNRQFHNADIAVYRCPSAKTETGQANYSVILGEGLPFAEDGQGRTLDGRNPRTLLVVERIKGIPWMQPNLEMTLENTVNRTGQTDVDLPGSKHASGMEVGLIDGSVLFLRDEFDNEKFDNLLRGE